MTVAMKEAATSPHSPVVFRAVGLAVRDFTDEEVEVEPAGVADDVEHEAKDRASRIAIVASATLRRGERCTSAGYTSLVVGYFAPETYQPFLSHAVENLSAPRRKMTGASCQSDRSMSKRQHPVVIGLDHSLPVGWDWVNEC